MPRRTLAGNQALSGVGLHTGARTNVRLGPGRPGSGIVFQRDDLDGAPSVTARIGQVTATERRVGLAHGAATVDTVEHLLAAAHAWQLDDLLVALDGPEVPMLDGSFVPWFDAIERAGIAEHVGDPAVVSAVTPFAVQEGDARYVVAPGKGLQLTATIEWDHPVIGRQSASFGITPDVFRTDIARARTFGFTHELAALKERGLIQGASPDMAVLLSETGIASGELQWPDEFVRHKIGDVLGDLALLGARVDAHIVAERPSHQGNVALAQALARRGQRIDPTRLDISMIMRILPHRYPILLVDRIVEVEPGNRIVAIKNVTINEPFFAGHFPGHPIMPGVLIVEAMAQAGGVLLMNAVEDASEKLVFFTSLDGVRFRRPVVPGDQLRLEVELVQMRGRTCRTRGQAFVDGQLVCEAESMMARLVDR